MKSNSPLADKFSRPYSIMEKVQVTAFCIQESIISGLYVYSTRKILKPGETFQKKRTRQVMLHLIYVNILVILMDITLLCTEYANLYEIQIAFKGALYSIKLRLEFTILNQLRSIACPSDSSHENPNSAYSRSDGRDVALNTFNNRTQLAQGQANEISSRNYICSASRQTTSPFSGKMDDNCVVLTTEVVVKSEEPSQHDGKGSQNKDGIGSTLESIGARTNAVGNGRSSRQKATHSPNSSEVEFAGAGY